MPLIVVVALILWFLWSGDDSYRYVTASALNVRDCPSTECAVVDTLKRGEKTPYEGDKEGWARLGEGRFASAQYLATYKPSAVRAVPGVSRIATAPKSVSKAPHKTERKRAVSHTACQQASYALALVAQELNGGQINERDRANGRFKLYEVSVSAPPYKELHECTTTDNQTEYLYRQWLDA